MIDFKNGGLFKLKKVDRFDSDDIQKMLISGENVIGYYKGIRDYVCFTDKRIICVNVQGLTGKKRDFTSMPYSKIQTFSVETSGVFDMDSELQLYFSSIGMVTFEFTGGSDILKISKIIATYALA